MPAIKKPNQHFDATLYTGNDGTQSITNSGFQPDLVWVKSRQYTTVGHSLFDSLRPIGANTSLPRLVSNSTAAEATNGGLTAFVSNGFSLNNDAYINSSTTGGNMVAWQWNAGGSTVTNTSGTISSQVRANPTAGFSVVTWTSTGANATIGHGLGVAPKMVIVKGRSAISQWFTWHTGLTSGAYALILNLTDAQDSYPTVFNSTTPTSSVFSVGTSLTASTTAVAYCFSEVAGYSAFGSYTGNGSTDGPFVYLGFRPRFVLFRSTSSRNWVIRDTSRDTYNTSTSDLYPDATNSTGAGADIDILSNGFKLRATSATFNGSGETYIYAAFAETPQKYANAR